MTGTAQAIDHSGAATTPMARDDAPPESVVDTTLEAADDLLVEEIRIDDLSVDGMCGVY